MTTFTMNNNTPAEIETYTAPAQMQTIRRWSQAGSFLSPFVAAHKNTRSHQRGLTRTQTNRTILVEFPLAHEGFRAAWSRTPEVLDTGNAAPTGCPGPVVIPWSTRTLDLRVIPSGWQLDDDLSRESNTYSNERSEPRWLDQLSPIALLHF